jgi:hypothetical protein
VISQASGTGLAATMFQPRGAAAAAPRPGTAWRAARLGAHFPFRAGSPAAPGATLAIASATARPTSIGCTPIDHAPGFPATTGFGRHDSQLRRSHR